MIVHASLSIALLGLAGAPTAFSQDWDWKLTPYLWASGIEGDIGLGGLQGPVDADFADILDVAHYFMLRRSAIDMGFLAI